MTDGRRLAWFDAGAGASGDMLLGALVGAGAPLAVVRAAVDALDVEPVRLAETTVTRAGLAATRIDVQVPPSDVRRTWPDIRGLVESADLADEVRARALDVFARLARAEAAAHGTAEDEVHFHEVGALDSLADVVGASAALHALGIGRAACTAVTVGSGTVRTAHGVLPVPVPAVVALLREAGAPVRGGEVDHEACTPTGAALLGSVVSSWGALPAMTVDAVGTGAGGRDDERVPNVLRVLVGHPAEGSDPDGAVALDEAVVLEANVDDLDPRLWPGVLSALLAAGASDAWLTPILMKKGRPAHALSVLTSPERLAGVRAVVYAESSTIGMRVHRVRKDALEREVVEVDVRGRPVRVKLARSGGDVVNAAPEYEDVAAAAAALGAPVKAVLAEAVAAAHELLTR
ncbi:MAG TPA: nickel pincer cofactor biosynthesis protein LarC [Actinomycetes bacterium]|nr:nickel pincer cofactor biosynthesis protein LarC [Actinomycetes bacterium]